MPALMPNGKQQYTDSSGNPLSGGKLYTYAAGTSTPQATYSDAAGAVPNANPVVLNSRGEATIFWSSAPYKAVLKDSADVEIWSQDNLEIALIASDLASTAAGNGAALVGYSTLGITVKDALDLNAPLASPAFTGTPTAPTATAGDNSTKIATTAYADASAAAAAAAVPPQEFASDAETQAGLLTTKAVTPAGLAASMIGGIGQSWQDMTGSRALSTTYTNTTGRPIFVVFEGQGTTTASFTLNLFVSGLVAAKTNPYTSVSGQIASVSAVVPLGATYSFTTSSAVLSRVLELR